MRIITTLILTIAVCGSLHAQQIDSTISKKRFGVITCEYVKSKLEGGIVRYFVVVYFQDSDYKTISSLAFITFMEKSLLDEFREDLRKIVDVSNVKGQTVNITKPNYRLSIYDFSNEIYIYDKKRKGNSTSINNMIKVLDWLKTVELPE